MDTDTQLTLQSKILITGGWGFLGTHLRAELKRAGFKNVARMRKVYCDLTSQQRTNNYLRRRKPEIIVHLAGVVGGIGANKANPGKFFYENMQMGMNVLEYARKFGVKKVVMIGTVCSYPKFTEVPFKEESLWIGYPEETNAPYGIAKRALMEMGRTYHEQYGMNVINLIPVNLYGPGDTFDPHRSHVIPALILKCFQHNSGAFNSAIEVWGTGRPSREFLYVQDCARAIRMAIQEFDNDPQPVNIGTGVEITIKKLAQTIVEECGFIGILNFNSDYPDGQPRRCLDTSKAKELFGFEAEVDFRSGIRNTIGWFRRNSDEIARSLGVRLDVQR
jgi:GDP-L-fucose synthase